MSKNETIENKRKRLIFRSEHRGTKEMDLILGSFAMKYVPTLTADKLEIYEEILNESDPDLYNWITGQENLPSEKNNAVMELLLTHRFRDF